MPQRHHQLTPLLTLRFLGNNTLKRLFCGKLLSKLALLPGCRADGMADVRDLKSRGDFPRVGSTPTPGTTSWKKSGAGKTSAADLIAFCGSIRRGQIRLRTRHPASHENYSA